MSASFGLWKTLLALKYFKLYEKHMLLLVHEVLENKRDRWSSFKGIEVKLQDARHFSCFLILFSTFQWALYEFL